MRLSRFGRVLVLGLLALPLLAGCQQKTPCKAACSPYFSDLELADWDQTLRKASLSIAGRLPDSIERELVKRQGQVGLESVLDQMMTEEPFYDRLKEIYNDVLLTDRYLSDGTMILDPERFPTARYFEEYENNSPDFIANAYGANWGIGREPLNLIAYVVRNNRNFGEILTADYTLVSSYTAQSYGLYGSTFVGEPFSKENLLEARIPGSVHVGLLTTPSFLNRFPTSATNRNRHRSRYVYKLFLDVDVMLLGTRPLTTSNIDGDTPTMNDPACVSCHATVDPLAGMFQNWNDEGFYRPPERGWHDDMVAAGFNGENYKKDGQEPLRWLAQRIVKAPGFQRAAVNTLYKGLIGDEPMGLPEDGETPEALAAIAAFEAQQAVLSEIGRNFKDSGYNLKTVVKGIILSPYFRARNIKEDAPAERDLDYAKIGMGRLLTPEMLNRKIKTVLALDRYWGEPGRLEPEQYLLSEDRYLIYYGGIDSVSTTTRITQPNGIQVNVARRMSNELACRAVALDFSQTRKGRALFPYVDAGTLPENIEDDTIEGGANQDAIRLNIQYLHDRLLDERRVIGDDELERTFNLYLETLRDGRERVARGETPAALPGDCQGNRDHWNPPPDGQRQQRRSGITEDADYNVRAWMAVVSYMLADYKFLYE